MRMKHYGVVLCVYFDISWRSTDINDSEKDRKGNG